MFWLGFRAFDDFAQDGSISLIPLIKFLGDFPYNGFGAFVGALGDVKVQTCDADGVAGVEDGDIGPFAIDEDAVTRLQVFNNIVIIPRSDFGMDPGCAVVGDGDTGFVGASECYGGFPCQLYFLPFSVTVDVIKKHDNPRFPSSTNTYQNQKPMDNRFV
jgi:hypothetical protein